MVSKKSILIISLISLVLIGGLIYFVLVLKQKLGPFAPQKEESSILTFVKENLREEFWPSEIQKEVKGDSSVSTSWVIDQNNFSILLKLSDGKEDYNLGIFAPEQKLLNPQTAKEIFGSYFIFTPETFTCSAPEVQLKEEAFECRNITDNKIISILSYKALDSDQEGTYISMSVKK